MRYITISTHLYRPQYYAAEMADIQARTYAGAFVDIDTPANDAQLLQHIVQKLQRQAEQPKANPIRPSAETVDYDGLKARRVAENADLLEQRGATILAIEGKITGCIAAQSSVQPPFRPDRLLDLAHARLSFDLRSAAVWPRSDFCMLSICTKVTLRNRIN